MTFIYDFIIDFPINVGFGAWILASGRIAIAHLIWKLSAFYMTKTVKQKSKKKTKKLNNINTDFYHCFEVKGATSGF